MSHCMIYVEIWTKLRIIGLKHLKNVYILKVYTIPIYIALKVDHINLNARKTWNTETKFLPAPEKFIEICNWIAKEKRKIVLKVDHFERNNNDLFCLYFGGYTKSIDYYRNCYIGKTTKESLFLITINIYHQAISFTCYKDTL